MPHAAPDPRTTVHELVTDWRIPATRIPPIFRNPQKLSRPPGLSETAIEAPYRLVISPSDQSGWTHAADPVPDASGTLAVAARPRPVQLDDPGRLARPVREHRGVVRVAARGRGGPWHHEDGGGHLEPRH